MANGLNGASLSYYGGRPQMWGLTSSGINTQDLIEMELAISDMKSYPVKSQKGYYEQELNSWKALNSNLMEFQKIAEKLKDLSSTNKDVKLSGEGFVNVTAGNNSIETNYNLEVLNVAKSHKILSDPMGDASLPLGKEGVVKINGTDLNITTDMSLNDVVKKINAGEYGVNASVISGTMSISSKKTGIENNINMEDGPEGILKEMGLLNSSGLVKNELQAGEDARIKIDGVEVTKSDNVFDNVVTGVSISVIKETAGSMNFSINQDKKAIKDAVSEFVSAYNKTIMRINQYTNKGAVLQGKTIINQAKSNLNRALTQPTDSKLFMYEVGIELDGVLRDGTIKFDESKLSKMIDENYDDVMKLMVGENSFSSKIFNTMDELTKDKGSLSTKISGLEKSIKGLDDTLVKYAESFERQKEMILTKYSRYEAMMSSLNLQGQFLTAQLDALNKKKD